jgi:hypothetical protein
VNWPFTIHARECESAGRRDLFGDIDTNRDKAPCGRPVQGHVGQEHVHCLAPWPRCSSQSCTLASSSQVYSYSLISIENAAQVTSLSHPIAALMPTHLPGKLYAPYFPSHPERDVYVTLLQMNDPPVHEALLKSALVRRAMTDVVRVVRLREDKPALQNLLQKGSIGDDLWNSLLQAEKELEAEVMEVVAEANTFVEGWGTIIFQTAGELIANEKMRSVYDGTAASRASKGRDSSSSRRVFSSLTLIAHQNKSMARLARRSTCRRCSLL